MMMLCRGLFLVLLLASTPVWAGTGADAPGYGERVGRKFGSGYTNMVLGLAEIPKNAIITTNQTNALFGATGGVFKGILHGVGRTLAGALDLITCPYPSEPIPKPAYVWENFQTETQYGPMLQIK